MLVTEVLNLSVDYPLSLMIAQYTSNGEGSFPLRSTYSTGVGCLMHSDNLFIPLLLMFVQGRSCFFIVVLLYIKASDEKYYIISVTQKIVSGQYS